MLRNLVVAQFSIIVVSLCLTSMTTVKHEPTTKIMFEARHGAVRESHLSDFITLGDLQSPEVYNYSTFLPMATEQEPAIIVVTNDSDIVNGDTSSLNALINNPGPDGISFREAVIASNNTPGPKRINFAPSLMGAKITFAANADIILLSSGDLTIDGDIDGDGTPDITLDGSLGTDNTPSGPGLNIWSSNNIIKGLTFNQFAGPSIQIAVPAQDPTVKSITGNKILGNNISSTRSTLMAIKVGPMGLLPASAYAGVTDIHIQDTVIAGNTIAYPNGILVNAAEGGSSRSKITNITIDGNDITGQEVGLSVMAADSATDYFGLPEPIYYSDNNTVENVIISNNRLGAELYNAISIAVGNYGNRRNRIVNTKITGNTITNAGQGGIYLGTANDGSTHRNTSDNDFTDIEIRQNEIRNAREGILVGVAEKDWFHISIGLNNNTMNRLFIIDNVVQDYQSVGIRIWGGLSVSNSTLGSYDNTLDGLVVSENQISTTKLQGNPVGMEILGGWSRAGPAWNNWLQGITISNNIISGNSTGIWLVGGRGLGSQKNYIFIDEMQGNTLEDNAEPIRITDNDEGATGNDVMLGGFKDVPSSYWAYNYIMAIYNAGITTGCAQDDPNTPENERRYCPDDNVTRGQMAAFIIRAKYGENFTYTQTPYFSDVPEAHTFFKYVQKLRDDGITAVSGTYGVDNEVTRGQMAAFIIRAKFGETFSYTTTPYFSDVPTTQPFFKYVQKLKDEGITAVTGTYGVDNIVTRAQMAAFLARAFLGME